MVLICEDVLSRPEPVLEIPYGNGDDHAEGMTLFADPTAFAAGGL